MPLFCRFAPTLPKESYWLPTPDARLTPRHPAQRRKYGSQKPCAVSRLYWYYDGDGITCPPPPLSDAPYQKGFLINGPMTRANNECVPHPYIIYLALGWRRLATTL